MHTESTSSTHKTLNRKGGLRQVCPTLLMSRRTNTLWPCLARDGRKFPEKNSLKSSYIKRVHAEVLQKTRYHGQFGPRTLSIAGMNRHLLGNVGETIAVASPCVKREDPTPSSLSLSLLRLLFSLTLCRSFVGSAVLSAS